MAGRGLDKRQGTSRKYGEATVSIGDLLPYHLRVELRSTEMNLLLHASLQDPQAISADKKISVVLDNITKEVITVRCFSSNSYSSYSHTLLMCNTIHEIFVGESTLDSDAVRLFLQAIALIFGKKALIAIRADQLLESANMTLVIDDIDPEDEQAMQELATDAETLACMTKIGVSNMPNPQIVTMAYCGAILLLAGKKLTEASVVAWTGRRIRGLAASMGTSVELSSVISFNTQAAVRVYQKLSMLVPLRAKMVRILFETTGTGSPVAALSAAMLNLLAWSEMNHIRMIQDYLFGRFPELLAIKQLQGSIGVLKTAWDYLNGLDERERPYAKLLYGPQHTKALRRDQFVLLTDAAHAVKSYLHSSFTHYQGDTQGTAGSAIKKIVRDYLYSLDQAAQYTTMDQRLVENIPKVDLLFQQQLNDLDV